MPNEIAHRYYATFLNKKPTLDDMWCSQTIQNTIAIILGWIFITALVKIANSIIDYILLNNFPTISNDWCYAERGLNSSRLHRVQEILKYGIYAVALAMRWPGRTWYNLHLGQCVLYAVAGFAAFEVAMVLCLLVIQAFLWTAHWFARVLGWSPSRARAERIWREEREEGWALRRACKCVDKKGYLERLGWSGNVAQPNDAPRHVSDGSWKKNEKSFFVERDGSAQATASIIYYTITAGPENQTLSLEELRLQHYEKASLAASPPESRADTPVTELAVTQSTDSNRGSILPDWMTGRSFRESIFGSSLSSNRSHDSFGQSLYANETAAAAPSTEASVTGQSAEVAVPDLLTGSPIVGRKFL